MIPPRCLPVFCPILPPPPPQGGAAAILLYIYILYGVALAKVWIENSYFLPPSWQWSLLGAVGTTVAFAIGAGVGLGSGAWPAGSDKIFGDNHSRRLERFISTTKQSSIESSISDVLSVSPSKRRWEISVFSPYINVSPNDSLSLYLSLSSATCTPIAPRCFSFCRPLDLPASARRRALRARSATALDRAVAESAVSVVGHGAARVSGMRMHCHCQMMANTHCT